MLWKEDAADRVTSLPTEEVELWAQPHMLLERYLHSMRVSASIKLSGRKM
jgi:hypothetical protein